MRTTAKLGSAGQPHSSNGGATASTQQQQQQYQQQQQALRAQLAGVEEALAQQSGRYEAVIHR